MTDRRQSSPVDEYWKSEVDPCRRCAGIAPDVVCEGAKVRPFVGSATPAVIVLAQDPTLRARPSTNVVMEMDNVGGKLRKFVVEEILRPLGFDVEQAYVTDLVKCRFAKTPNELASERRMNIVDIIRPAVDTCLRHLEWEFSMVDPEVVVTLGLPVYELLAEFCKFAPLDPLRDVVGHVLPKLMFGRERIWIPCVHWKTLHGRWRHEHYVELQPQKLVAAKSILRARGLVPGDR